MTCQEFTKIQAFIDAELPREERKQFSLHLEECRECQETIEEMKKLDQWMDVRIKNSLPEPDPTLPIDTEKAWQQFQTLVHKNDIHPSMEVKKTKKNWRENMKKSTKRWIVTAASIAILGGGLCIPQVQTLANEFLSIFRLNRVEFVKLTQDDIQKVSSALSGDQKGTFDLKGLGSIRAEIEGKDLFFQSAKDAKKKGIAFPDLPAGSTITDVSKTVPRSIYIKLNTEKANQLLKQFKAKDVQLSDSLNNKTFIVHTPEVYSFSFTKNGKEYRFTQFNMPRIEVDKGVDVNEIRKVVLALPFIPDSIKDKFIDPNNWKTTFFMPIFDEKHQVKEITFNGGKAIAEKSEYACKLIWQKDGKIHQLSSYEEKQDVDALKKLAMQIKK